jgi:hypothetical protein
VPPKSNFGGPFAVLLFHTSGASRLIRLFAFVLFVMEVFVFFSTAVTFRLLITGVLLGLQNRLTVKRSMDGGE